MANRWDSTGFGFRRGLAEWLVWVGWEWWEWWEWWAKAHPTKHPTKHPTPTLQPTHPPYLSALHISLQIP
ncbi:TPA: hypothetical protein ACFNM3_001757 [Neisseria lactamica]